MSRYIKRVGSVGSGPVVKRHSRPPTMLGFRLIAVSLFSLLALGEPQYNYPVPGPAPTPTPPATSDGSSLAGSTMDVSSNFYGMHDHLHTLSVPDHGSSWWCINV